MVYRGTCAQVERRSSLVLLGRTKNTQGFTLAELLLALAIVLILAALAAPSISNIQRTMRMAQLDAAASDIAVAAQHQMTSMKVSGTWLTVLDENEDAFIDSGDSDAPTLSEQLANSVPQAIAAEHDASDLLYMTASQAIAMGILPVNSIDNNVRSGDFIIEYSASTATVFGVFYTDRKTGFFQTASVDPDNPNPAQNYYTLIKSEAGRTQVDRIKANPMIGYFGGTPAGATNEVALANPTIWVNDEGWLCIQDSNLSKHPEWLTSLEVLIENQKIVDEKTGEKSTATIAFAGLQGGNNTTTYQAGVDLEDAENHSYSNSDKLKLYAVVDRDATDELAPPSASADVYKFDLEMLKRSSDSALIELAAGFEKGDPVKVTAMVKTGEKPFTPAESTAYIEWPDPLVTLNVVVTDPTTGEVDDGEKAIAGGSHIKGSYVAPEVKAMPTSGLPLEVNHIKEYAEKYEIANTSTVLTDEEKGNTEAAFQRYTGGRIGLDQAEGDGILVEATVGSYTSPQRIVHYYQIHELWIGVGSDPQTSTKERVGYMVDNEWRWVGKGETLAASIGGIEAGADTASPDNFVTSITIDPIKLKTALEAWKIDDQTVTLYVRTAPSIDEARKYFTGKQERLGKEAGAGEIGHITDLLQRGITTGSRGIDAGDKLDFRRNFENEFGCPSSDASYAITRKSSSDQSPIQEQFPGNTDDIRIYYAITPAFGFNSKLDAPDNSLPNTALWYYNAKEKTVYPQAMVYPSRSGQTSSMYYMAATSGNADFEFKTDRDYLFYRVLRYYDSYETSDSGKITYTDPLSIDNQYVPFSASNDPSVATLATAKTKVVDGITKVGAGWKTFNVNTYLSPKITEVEMHNGDLVGAYHDQLDYKGTYLVAQYQDLSAGMMYLEFGSGSNEAIGWSGYTTPDAEHFKKELPDNSIDIETWGYYVIVPAGAMDTTSGDKIAKTGKGSLENESSKTVTIDGVTYDAYRLTGTGDALKTNQEITISLTKKDSAATVKATYTVNLNFASAVTIDSEAAKDWGTKSDSPWSVRHATQFIGALPWVGSVQSEYAAHWFKQDHDIDMLDAFSGPAVTNSNYKFTSTFKGVYDGQNNAITGFERTLYFMNGVNPQGYSVDDGNGNRDYGQGLFPYVLGDDAGKGSLTNIKLVVQGEDIRTSYGTNSHASFGWLVGVLDGGSISGCSLVGLSSSGVATGKDNEVKLMLEQSSAGTTTVGMLAGKIKNSKIVTGLSVSGVEMTYICRSNRWDKPLQIGGLVGTLSNSKAHACTVSNVAIKMPSGLSATVIQSKHAASVGGLFGRVEEASVVAACSVAETSIVFPGLKFEKGGSAYYGLVAGNVSNSTVKDSTIRQVEASMDSLLEFGAKDRIIAVGGVVGGAGIDAASESGSAITDNMVSSLAITFETTQESTGLSVGWSAGLAGATVVIENVMLEPDSVSYRLGQLEEFKAITDQVGGKPL